MHYFVFTIFNFGWRLNTQNTPELRPCPFPSLHLFITPPSLLFSAHFYSASGVLSTSTLHQFNVLFVGGDWTEETSHWFRPITYCGTLFPNTLYLWPGSLHGNVESLLKWTGNQCSSSFSAGSTGLSLSGTFVLPCCPSKLVSSWINSSVGCYHSFLLGFPSSFSTALTMENIFAHRFPLVGCLRHRWLSCKSSLLQFPLLSPEKSSHSNVTEWIDGSVCNTESSPLHGFKTSL